MRWTRITGGYISMGDGIDYMIERTAVSGSARATFQLYVRSTRPVHEYLRVPLAFSGLLRNVKDDAEVIAADLATPICTAPVTADQPHAFTHDPDKQATTIRNSAGRPMCGQAESAHRAAEVMVWTHAERESFEQNRAWVARHDLLSGRPEHVNGAIEADHAEALAANAGSIQSPSEGCRYTVQIIARGNHGFAYVNDAETGDVAQAFTGRAAGDSAQAWADGANGEAAEADEIIHSWTSDSAPAACGVDVLHTPYTYGSPELAEVTCVPCREAVSVQEPVRVGTLDGGVRVARIRQNWLDGSIDYGMAVDGIVNAYGVTPDGAQDLLTAASVSALSEGY